MQGITLAYKDREKELRYRKEWYEKNKVRRKQQVIDRRKEIWNWYSNYKLTLKCSICGETHPACIEHHHLDASEKEQNIGEMAAQGHSIDSISKEIEKCIILCSNCHRKLHYTRELTQPQEFIMYHTLPKKAEYVELTCYTCGEKFKRSKKEHERNMRKGHKNVYCSKKCVLVSINSIRWGL